MYKTVNIYVTKYLDYKQILKDMMNLTCKEFNTP